MQTRRTSRRPRGGSSAGLRVPAGGGGRSPPGRTAGGRSCCPPLRNVCGHALDRPAELVKQRLPRRTARSLVACQGPPVCVLNGQGGCCGVLSGVADRAGVWGV